MQLQVLRNFGTEQNPDVRRQESQLNGWRSELTRLESQQSSDPVFSKGRAPVQAQQYMRTMREVRYGEALLEMLLRQSEAAKLDEARETTIIQVGRRCATTGCSRLSEAHGHRASHDLGIPHGNTLLAAIAPAIPRRTGVAVALRTTSRGMALMMSVTCAGKGTR